MPQATDVHRRPACEHLTPVQPAPVVDRIRSMAHGVEVGEAHHVPVAVHIEVLIFKPDFL